MRPRHGFTLLELLVVLAVTAVLMGVALPRVVAISDAVAVRHAADQVRTVLALARQRAVAFAAPVAVLVDSAAAQLAVGDAQGPLSTHAVGAAYGVTLTATRDSVAFGPLGLGWGAANTSVVVTRGAAAETVTVSRAGRIR
jgi:prepilin-type N-terminal cleavage/methylation domain-containing protein